MSIDTTANNSGGGKLSITQRFEAIQMPIRKKTLRFVPRPKVANAPRY